MVGVLRSCREVEAKCSGVPSHAEGGREGRRGGGEPPPPLWRASACIPESANRSTAERREGRGRRRSEAETVGRHVREREERSEAERMRSDLREMERTGEGRRG